MKVEKRSDEKDAARYRWLRENLNGWGVTFYHPNGGDEEVEWDEAKELDKLIDRRIRRDGGAPDA